MTKNFFQISTAIDYPSARFHLGHAYEKICADTFARWKRMSGFKVHFSTGTDCHGLKIQRLAEKAGKTPLEFSTEISAQFKELCNVLNISYDDFIMTLEKRHEKTVVDILKKLKANGDIYAGEYEGLYCVDCETYYTEKDLENGNCPVHKKKCELIKEPSYFFRLSKYQEMVIKAIEEDLLWPKKKKHEILERLKEPLKDLSISRKQVKWGIRPSFDDSVTTFVWVDALINYLTTVNYPSKEFKEFWPATHFIGPDIVWHHTTIWYSLLSALQLKIPKVIVHGFINLEGEKLSKARGITVDPIDLANKYSTDGLRYFLLRSIPFGDDGDFSEQALKDRHNNELANKLGNLVSRTAGMCKGEYKKSALDKKLSSKLKFKEIGTHMEEYGFDRALSLIFEYLDECNNYVQTKEPWKLEGKAKEKVLYNLVDSIRVVSILLEPFMPGSCQKIREQFGFEKPDLKKVKFGLTKSGKIEKSEILFKKIE